MCENEDNIITIGKYVIVKKLNFKKIYKVTIDGTLMLGKDLVQMHEIIGKRFWTTFEMIPMKDKKRTYFLKEVLETESLNDLLNELPSGTDNRSIVDDGKSQKLSKEEIFQLQESGKSSKEIVSSLIENNKSFLDRTEYSQEKYLKKKEKKYFRYITIWKPNISSLHDIYFKLDHNKIGNLRMDSLSQLLSYSDVQSDGLYILYDSGSHGLPAAAMLNRIGSNTKGYLINLHPGNVPQTALVHAMNFSTEQLTRLINVNIYSFLRLYYQGENAVLNNISKKCNLKHDLSNKIKEDESKNNNENHINNKISRIKEENIKARNSDSVNESNENETIDHSIDNNLKRKLNECNECKFAEVTPAKKPKWLLETQRAVNLFTNSKARGLAIIAKEHPLNIIVALLPFLGASRPFVIYHMYRESLQETYMMLKQKQNVINLRLFSNFLRSYQVLPDRTHPDILSSDTGVEFAIDRGGTFTDVYARCPGGKIRVMKLLSVDPANYDDAPREGIRRILEQETGKKIEGEIDASLISWIRMGTTVATNALLERKGAKMALLINEGFKDLLFIGNQARPDIFDLQVITPEVLYEKVVEVRCRVIPASVGKCQLDNKKWRRVKGSTGEDLFITRELDEEKLKLDLEELRRSGIESLAVVLAHSYTYGEHEIRIGELAKLAGFLQVSLSHEIMPMVRIVPRGFTACADAYLTPHIKQYLQGFSSGFKDKLKNVNVLFMQSDGGLTPMNSFNGSRAILSGPAGGVVGYAITTYSRETDLPVIGFDMGGTSTDVSRFGGSYEHVYESTTAGVTIQAAQLDVNTVAAGGGSMLFFRSGLFEVGPESAGAHPGPACYKKNGPLAVTDANLALGRLLPEYFPKIFGPNENEPLDKSRTMEAFQILTSQINEFLAKEGHGVKMSIEEVAMGFVRVANETMCRPIRALTQAKGYDTSRHVLACFGGAGGQHACAIARSLGMGTVFVHKYAGILSAYGMALADVVEEAQEPSAEVYEQESFARLDERLDALEKKVRAKLAAQGFPESHIKTEPFLHLRYEGTDCALMCTASQDTKRKGTKHGDFLSTFLERYETEFGFTMPNRKIVVNDVRIRGTGRTDIEEDPILPSSNEPPKFEKTTMVYFENGYQETKVYQLRSLSPGHAIHGPAIIMDSLSTLLIEPDCYASITPRGDARITIGQGSRAEVTTELDTVQLSIFSHRFMSIAEQMGRILQRTAISTNIKERLDFSCAVFGSDGGLVSNAPHIPVHLGAMQETVQYQMKAFKGEFERGDVILANHPLAGGSHLPDLTVITPVFYEDVEKPVFFVASRGHHADIGGITPGSMPPHSTCLLQEGATFKSFLLVHRGVFREKELTEALMEPGKIEGSSGTRNLSDNLSDLKAQIAANHKGSTLVNELIDIYGLDVVQAYMGHIQRNAEVAVRDMLKSVGKRLLEQSGNTVATAIDYLDDGSPIQFLLNIDVDKGEAVCDFSGTGYEVWGNCNAPRAITLSALIYCLRCIVGRDVPLNQGCLKPVKVIIPKGSLLDPSEEAAVVGGNVLTSQRVVDVVLRAFGACAASQGCMNNVTLGTEEWGYYETVAGGSGAGPTWDGRGGVHTHMTNTRITDPEILELRYPVILNKFSLRTGSGGAGVHRGGDGVVRETTFRAPMTLSVLTERRVNSPPGLAGGGSGSRGRNTLVKADGRKINLGPKTAVPVYPGDTFILETPGGGGYGPPGVERAGSIRRKPRGFVERGSVFEYRKAQESV